VGRQELRVGDQSVSEATRRGAKELKELWLRCDALERELGARGKAEGRDEWMRKEGDVLG
jgi:hypothetical protein